MSADLSARNVAEYADICVLDHLLKTVVVGCLPAIPGPTATATATDSPSYWVAEAVHATCSFSHQSIHSPTMHLNPT
jgi:hypothetical protein